MDGSPLTHAQSPGPPWARSVPSQRSRRIGALLLSTIVGFALVWSGQADATHPDPPGHDHTVYHWDLPAFPGGPHSYGVNGDRVEYIAWTSDASFRWTVDTAHSTRVFIVLERDYSLFEAVDIGAHKTNAHRFSNENWFVGNVMVLRGQSLYGWQYNRNGVLYI